MSAQIAWRRVQWILLGLILATSGILARVPSCSFALSLPDGRAYELVSPAQKTGGIGGVFPLGSLTHSLEQFARPFQSSANGSGVIYLGEDFYKPDLGSLNQYLSQRNLEGWSTQNLTSSVLSTSNSAIEANLYVGYSPDLSVGVLSLLEGRPIGYANLYVAPQGASAQPLLTAAPPHRTAATFGDAKLGSGGIEPNLLFAGGNRGTTTNPAFSHLLFAANDALTPNAEDGGPHKNNLYEWTVNGLRPVNILPMSEKSDPGASIGVDYGDEYNNLATPSMSNAISADGSRIFWTDENNHHLYVREDGVRTTQVDAAAGGAGGGLFQSASADGSRVLFIKLGALYEFHTSDATTSQLVDESGGVEGVVGASDDGTYVYFVATGVLAEGATAGEPNLYLAREDSTHHHIVTFITTLSPADNEIPGFYGPFTVTPLGDWYRTFAGHTAEVSPNGRYIAFMSLKSLTGYDNRDAVSAFEHDYEVFLYDSATGRLTCASCNRDGSRPTSSTVLPAPVNGVYQQRYLDDNGRLFFSTQDAVLAQDTNHLSDVYEYESGDVHLITPGQAPDEALFADASESGNDVFFTTRQQLVPADQDPIVDLYDARVGGRSEAPPSSPCSGEACRQLPISTPSIEPPPSAIFTGAGNLAPPPSKSVKATKKTVKKKVVKRHRKVHRKKAGKSSKGRRKR